MKNSPTIIYNNFIKEITQHLIFFLTLLISSNILFSQAVAPAYVNFGNDPKTEAIVSWLDSSATPITFEYGLTAAYGQTVSTTLELVDLYYVHHAVLTGLTPDTPYHYNDYGTDAIFKTAPAGPEAFSWSLWEDTQQADYLPVFALERYASYIVNNHNPAFAIQAGDWVMEGEDIQEWEAVFKSGEELQHYCPIMPVVGNHEVAHSDTARLYTALFDLPDNNDSEGNNEQWYSFEYGDAIFLSLTNFPTFWGYETHIDLQALWIDSVLSESNSKWKFVVVHDGMTNTPPSWKTVFEKHSVNAVFSGHAHYQSQFIENGIMYMMSSKITRYNRFINFVNIKVGLDNTELEVYKTDYIDSADYFSGTLAGWDYINLQDSYTLTIDNEISLGSATYNIDEDAGTATFEVIRTGNVTESVSVNWTTSDSSATAGNDYTAGSGTITFGVGERGVKTFTVDITDDIDPEFEETFNISLSGESGIVLGSPTKAIVTIAHSDLPTYALTVNSGSGDGSYIERSVVAISANTPPANMLFNYWSGDVLYISDVNAENTNVTMPDQIVSIIANYRSDTASTYTLTVNSGYGGGSFTENSTISIYGNGALTGQVFDLWAGDTAYIDDINNQNTSITMPAQNISVTAQYIDVPYSLTITEGSGTGTYIYNTEININANTAPVGQVFDAWTGDIEYVIDANDSTSTITMPAQDITLAATYRSNSDPKYSLTVTSGIGDGEYFEDAVVKISASAPGYGQGSFYEWTGDVSNIANTNDSSTTITIPAQNIAITATYTSLPIYNLTINNGSGSGNYFVGEVVNIDANSPPVGQEFSIWVGNTTNMDDVSSPSTFITMPGSNVAIGVVYTDLPTSITSSFKNKVAIYPNPASDFVYLKNVENVSSITILNGVGQVVLNKNDISSGTPINISHFENGIYIVRIMKDGNSQNLSLVKY